MTATVGKTEALAKIKSLGEKLMTCHMMTGLDQRPISTRPMTIQKIDDQSRIIFISNKGSDKNQDVERSNEMQLTIADAKDNEFLCIYGTAEIYRDQADVDEIYDTLDNNWFKGKDDPNITLIRFTPKSGNYWDAQAKKPVVFGW